MGKMVAVKSVTESKCWDKEGFCDIITDYLKQTVDCTDVKEIAINVQRAVKRFLDVALIGIFIEEEGKLQQIIPKEGLPEGFFFRESREYAAVSTIRTKKMIYRKVVDYKDELLKQELIAIGGKSVLCIPINCGGEVLGAFSVILKEEKVLDKDVYGFCTAICGFFSVQLKNALLHAELGKQLCEKIRVETDLDVIFRGSVDMIGIISNDGYLKRINPAFEERLGYSRQELFSRPIYSFAHPEDESFVRYVVENIEKEGVIRGFCHRFLSKEGKVIFLEVDVRSMEDTGEMIAIARDTTNQRAAEERNMLLEKSIELERMKTEFFSNISHEFKTPINIILSSADLLKLKLQRDNELLYQEQYKRFFDYTEQNSYKLLRLINNLLDCTKLENGAVTLLGQDCEVVPFVRQVVKTCEGYAQAHRLSLEFTTELSEDAVLYCDLDKLDRVLLNLISNGIKYTPEGGALGVHMDETPTHVRISVSDSGEGIGEAMLPYIFEKFKVCNNGFIKSCDGTGVGLSIVKGLIELHGGTVCAKSTPGEGSTFTVTVSKSLRESGTTQEMATARHQEDGGLHQSRLQMEMSNVE